MKKVVVVFENFDGEQESADVYFNLTDLEVAELGLSDGQTFKDKAEELIKLKDKKDEKGQSQGIASSFELIKLFIDKSYGVRSEDGKRFVKNAQVLEDFKSTPIYSAFVMQLMSNEADAASFISGVLPKKVQEQYQKALTQTIGR